MRSFRLFTAILALAASLVACTSASQGQAPPRATPSPTVVRVAVPTSPTPLAVDLPLTVDRVGASASPTGFMAFALVSNPSSRVAADVGLQISAVSASGAELEHASAGIARIDPSQTQAVAVRMPATQFTPAAFKASITGYRRLDPGTETQPVQVIEAAFVQDPRTPTVRVRVANHATVQEKVAITAICLDEAGALRGGGTSAAIVAASSGGQNTWVPVWVPVIPASCQGYVLTE